MSRPIFVTTALPYANGSFHIGHIMEYIQADISGRSMRMSGDTVHLVCAADHDGAPIILKAAGASISPAHRVHKTTAERPTYLNGVFVKFGHWHRTDSPGQVVLAQVIFRTRKGAGLIDTRIIEQCYDPFKR